AYQVRAHDPEGGPLNYWLVTAAGDLVREIKNSDQDWMKIDGSGKVTWTVPTGVSARSFTVRAVDNQQEHDQEVFNIAVGANQAPSVSMRPLFSGDPVPGSRIEFLVVATDDAGV